MTGKLQQLFAPLPTRHLQQYYFLIPTTMSDEQLEYLEAYTKEDAYRDYMNEEMQSLINNHYE